MVSNYTAGIGTAPSTFTLTLTTIVPLVPTDNTFAILTGFQDLSHNVVVDVFQQPTTTLVGIGSVANGNTVRVRGLLFFDTVSLRYKFVCSRILAP